MLKMRRTNFVETSSLRGVALWGLGVLTPIVIPQPKIVKESAKSIIKFWAIFRQSWWVTSLEG